MAERPPRAFRHDRRPAIGALAGGSLRNPPARRCRGITARPWSRRSQDEAPACDKRHWRMTHPPDPDLLSLNTATVREKWNLRQMIEGCARHRIRGISPWRDKLAEMGVKEAARSEERRVGKGVGRSGVGVTVRERGREVEEREG